MSNLALFYRVLLKHPALPSLVDLRVGAVVCLTHTEFDLVSQFSLQQIRVLFAHAQHLATHTVAESGV